MSLKDRLLDFISGDDDMEEDESFMTSREDRREEYIPRGPQEVPRRNNKVVSVSAATQLQVVLVKPERFEDASTVADHLNERRTVVLNLEQTDREISRRFVDFLSGVAYANGGQIKKVANSTFIITPHNVDIMGDILGELESNGVFL
jgi:cell division inhibitor SepF